MPGGIDPGQHQSAAPIILDGCGVCHSYPSNGDHLACAPGVDRRDTIFPDTAMTTSGRDVGLPAGQDFPPWNNISA